jgi:hypothetical protein
MPPVGHGLDVRIVHLDASNATPIEAFGIVRANSVAVADGRGEAHAYVITFEPGGLIGPHVAGFGQLCLPTAGKGWIAGEDGVRVAISHGVGGFVTQGEIHSKGSDRDDDADDPSHRPRCKPRSSDRTAGH